MPAHQDCWPSACLTGVWPLARACTRTLREDTENLRVGLEPGLTPAEYGLLRHLGPHVAEMCEQLASYGLPETLAHEEVHENNVKELSNLRSLIYTEM